MFNGLEVEAGRVVASDAPLFGFLGEKNEVEGGADLLVTLSGTSIKCRFVIVNAPSCNNAIFKRALTKFFKVVSSSYHQCLKQCQEDAQECYLDAISTINWMEYEEEIEKVMEGMARLEAIEEVEVLSEGGKSGLLNIGGALMTSEKVEMVACQQGNVDIFAWSDAEMSKIDVEVVCHRLNLDPEVKPIRQKKWAS